MFIRIDFAIFHMTYVVVVVVVVAVVVVATRAHALRAGLSTFSLGHAGQ